MSGTDPGNPDPGEATREPRRRSADTAHGVAAAERIPVSSEAPGKAASSAATAARGEKRYPRLAVFLPALAALITIWGIVAAFTISERGTVLERTQSQLDNTASTLVELSALAERAAAVPGRPGDPDRAAAFWRVLLQYPTAWIWIETDGKISTGQPPPRGTGNLIVVAAASGHLTAHAALTQTDALVDWRRSMWQRVAALLVTSAGFLVMADRLSRAMIQRAAAERGAATAEERATQLNLYRAQLEETVAQRTAELKQSNVLLGKQLSERIAAEAALRQHDLLLTAVTRSAAALLGEGDLKDAISVVLELIGRTTSVARVLFAAIGLGPGGHFMLSVQQEWCAAGATRLKDNAELKNLELTARFPATARVLGIGQQGSVYSDDLSGPNREMFASAAMSSILLVPIRIGNQLSGSLNFIDSSQVRRVWTWAETDTLATLAELVGNAIARARRSKELADANMIVQNSPTVLFRLKGEPSLPLIYISQNIKKFGHSPVDLVGSPAWQLVLIDAMDRPRVLAALTGVLEKDASSASVEFRMLNGDGSRRWVEAHYSPVRDQSGRLVEIEGIMIDVTERKAAEEQILRLARTDPLTGLANRATFTERLHLAFNASRRGGTPFAVLYLDLDHFKDVNDTLGHPMGDLLLKMVAARLLSGVREADLVARFGGDEFAILQTDITDPATAGTLAEKLRVSVDLPYALKGNIAHVTASIGVAPLGVATVEADALLTQADLALYRAKDEGRDQYRFHTKDLDDEVRQRVSLTADLRQAIERNELELYYQPQVNLTSGKIVGMEALARWNHPTRGLVLPSLFISIAEKTGVILPLGRWVLDQACGQMRRWHDAGIAPPVLAVNVSMLELRNALGFVAMVTEILAKWGLAPSDLELDVTESMLAQISWARNDVLSDIRKIGVRIALDDFGTDYSSFDYLRRYQINHIKIAQSYIRTATDNPEHAQTIRAIIALAHNLDIDVIAEGVETAAERALLVSMGATTKGQGFYFSAAVTEAQASDLLRSGAITPVAALPGAQPSPARGLLSVDPQGLNALIALPPPGAPLKHLTVS